jgi:hypothetical protein
MGLKTKESGLFPTSQENILSHSVQVDSGADPAFYIMGAGAVSLGVKRQGLEADHSPPSGVEIKNCTAAISLLHSSSGVMRN